MGVARARSLFRFQPDPPPGPIRPGFPAGALQLLRMAHVWHKARTKQTGSTSLGDLRNRAQMRESVNWAFEPGWCARRVVWAPRVRHVVWVLAVLASNI